MVGFTYAFCQNQLSGIIFLEKFKIPEKQKLRLILFAKAVLENPQHFLRARAGAGAKSENSCGRGGQKWKILRVRAVAGARKAPQAPATNIMANQCENFCGRGRARGPKVKNHAGAGGCGGQK